MMAENKSVDLEALRLKRPEAEPPSQRRGAGRRWLGLILALLLGVAAVWWLLTRWVLIPTVAVAPVIKIYPSQALTLLNASGYVVAQRKASVSSKSTGRLAYLGVEEGSRVKKGEVIARLENDDLVAARNRAEANLKAARAVLEQAAAEETDANLNYRRLQALLTQELVSRQEFDAAEARYRKAVAAVANAKANIRAATAALEEAQTAVEYSLIRAPFDGVVLTKNAEVGEVVAPFGAAANARAAVATMADMASLMVEADVAEANINQVREGQPCEILLDAFPERRFAGRVHMVVPTADRSKATILVKVAFETLTPEILPEMSAKVAFLSRSLETGEKEPRLAVQPGAVVKVNGEPQVFVLEGDRALRRPLTLGPALGDLIEVKAGLQEGEKVILKPPAQLRSGSRVKVKEG